jgi:hypothetical protein
VLDATARSTRSEFVDHRGTRLHIVDASGLRAAADVQALIVHRVLLQVLNQVARRERGLFDPLDAAKDWLLSQA